MIWPGAANVCYAYMHDFEKAELFYQLNTESAHKHAKAYLIRGGL